MSLSFIKPEITYRNSEVLVGVSRVDVPGGPSSVVDVAVVVTGGRAPTSPRMLSMSKVKTFVSSYLHPS